MRRIRQHLTYGNVMATIAVFLVLGGGGAYALSGSNTVFSDDIVNGQVRSQDLAQSQRAAGAVFARIENLQGVSGIRFGTVSGVADAAPAEGSVTSLSPHAPVLARDMRIKLTIPPNVSCPQAPQCSRRFILREDGVDTPVACTIAGAGTGCNSQTASALIDSGSRLSIKTTIPTGSPNTSPDALIGWRASTP